MDATANRALPYPELTDPPNAPAQLQALAEELDMDLFFTAGSGVPAAGTIGRVHQDTDDDSLQLDLGVGWLTLVTGGPYLPDIAGAITNPDRIASGILTATQLAANAVTNSKVQDGAITSGKLGASSVIAGKIGAGGVSATNQLADGIVSMAKFLGEAALSYTPTLTNVTLGTGGTRYGRYWKFGRLVVGVCGFQLGTGGNVTGDLAVGIPVAAAAGSSDWIMAVRATGTSSRASGMGVIEGGATTGYGFATLGAALWGATSPFDWNDNDIFRAVFIYEAAS